MKTNRNKIMPRNCHAFWLKNHQNPFKNAFNFFSLKPCTLYRRTDSNKYLKIIVLVNYALFFIGLNIMLRNGKPQLHIDFKN